MVNHFGLNFVLNFVEKGRIRQSLGQSCPRSAKGQTGASRPLLRQRGSLMIELLVAVALLAGCVLPLAYSIASERRYARALYQRAVAMEIVDGEIEALAAGQWRAFSNGACQYQVRARAATNLPPARFLLTVQPGRLRLEWRPERQQHGGPVVREAIIR